MTFNEESEPLQRDSVKKLGSLLLKLESLSYVSGNCVDELVEDLQFISSVASAQDFKNIIERTLEKHGCILAASVITDLVKELCESGPISTSLGLNGPFNSAYKRRRYFEENFSVVQPVEYIINLRAKRCFQYIPILKSLSQLLNNKHILEKAVENTETSKCGVTHYYKSFYDGSYFKESNFWSGDEFRLSLILYIDDFEVCNPLGTSRKKHKIIALNWVLGNIPSPL